ncbi:hypothetical protein [Infirmifilum lucidum]|uniref:hypothetical protein n=1 Tax=Infirmifilum lucidum TaxID=2776706 RepID=UPI001CECA4F5|nr:hypothetical protein [Infirmifilum lucidum]
MDIKEAILDVLSRDPLIKPVDFVDRVKERLEERGFFTGLVTAKRVWKVYEEMVRSGDVFDILGVVRKDKADEAGESFLEPR